MLKRITPLLLAMVFICQACIFSISAAPTVKFDKQFELSKSNSVPLGSHFDFTIEDEELDEDESQAFTDLSFLGYFRAELKISPNLNSSLSLSSEAILRTISANRDFICVYIL